MKDNTSALFTTVPVGRAVLSMAVPTILSQLITVAYNMADTFFIGRLNDPAQVAAATLSMPIYIFVGAFAGLFGIGGASVIARALGSGDRDRAKHCSAFCIWSAAFIALLYGFLIHTLRPLLFPLLGADAETRDYLSQYAFWTITVGTLPTVMSTTLSHLVRSEGYSKQAGFGIAFGGLLNIVLDPLFIFVFHWQIAGAAAATALSNLCSMLFFLAFLLRIRNDSVLTFSPRYYTLRQRIPVDVITVGLPTSVMTLMSTLSNAVLNHLIASYCTEAIAGMGIAKKIDILAFAIAQGMTQGTLPLVAYNYSSGNRKRMAEVVRTLFLDTVVVATAGFLGLFFGAEYVTGWFIRDAETVHYGTRFLKIICIACLTTSPNFVIITVFQAIGKRLQPMILSFLRKGTLDIPLMFLFQAIGGLESIPFATPCADALALAIALCLFLPCLRRIRNPDKS